MLPGARTLIVAIVTFATLTITAAATGARSPHSLYTKLLTTAYPDSQLPNGMFSAKVSLSQPSANGRRYHVVGEVQVAVDGPDPDDGITYMVFPNAADAHADFTHPSVTDAHERPVGNVPGYRIPSRWYVGSVTGKNAFGKTITNGITALFVQKGNVLVGAVTDSADNTDSGNTPAALQLLKSALKHLAAVSR